MSEINKNTKKRVLFVMHLPPPVHGASMIGQYIHKSELVNEEFDCRYVDMTTARSLEDIGKGGWSKYKHFLGVLWRIAKMIFFFRPHAIYITPNSAGGPFYKDFLVVEFIKLISLKIPTIILHFHNKGVKTRQDSAIDNLMYKHFFNSSKLILLSENLYEDVKKYVSRENCFYCPNGIPVNEDVAEINAKRDNKVPNILWLSNLMVTKGINEYLEALQILRKRGLKFNAIFVGASTMEMSVEAFESELAKYGLDYCTSYVGKKYGIEKIEYFINSDIFVLPSYTEAFPLTILEAMSYKMPVVASNVGGVSTEVIDGVTGLLVGGDRPIMENNFHPDPEELADKLETLIVDGDRRGKMGKAGYERFIDEFTLPVFERKFSEAMHRIIDNK